MLHLQALRECPLLAESGHSSFTVDHLSPRAGYCLNACPGIDTMLLAPAPVFAATYSGPSQFELLAQRDRIFYPLYGAQDSWFGDLPAHYVKQFSVYPLTKNLNPFL